MRIRQKNRNRKIENIGKPEKIQKEEAFKDKKSESLVTLESENAEKSLLEKTMDFVMERIMFFLRKRAGENLEVGCIVFCNEFGLLGKSENAISLLEECKNQF